MAGVQQPQPQQQLQADAFKRLYPEQYYDTFISQGIRTDGRTLSRARAVSIGLKAVGSADSSALVRIGSTTVMAGVRLEVFQPDDARPDQGQVAVAVDMTLLSTPDYRPGKPSDYTHALEQRVSEALLRTGLLDLRQLCISAGQAAWLLYLDLCVLDADGSLLDALLLAAVACLRDLRLPAVSVTAEGNVERSDGAAMDEGGGGGGGLALALACTPVCLTSGVYKGALVVDPSREEEALMSSVISVVLDEQAQLLGGRPGWAGLWGWWGLVGAGAGGGRAGGGRGGGGMPLGAELDGLAVLGWLERVPCSEAQRGGLVCAGVAVQAGAAGC
jgi:exosome complex component RRP43